MSGSQGYPPITRVNVSIQQGPTPSTYQRTGALISQGATTLTPGTYSLLVLLSSLTPLLKGAAAITSLTQSSGTATANCTAAHGITIGDTIQLTIMGAAQTAYNGTFLCTATTTTAFTYAVPSGTTSPATGTITYTAEDAAELVAMATTFFAQGGSTSVYVLELGVGNATDGIAALTAFETANPAIFYSYLLPHSWGVDAAFYTGFALNWTSPTGKKYFHVTTTLAFWGANPALFATTLKSCIVGVEAPAVAAAAAAGTPTEFSRAAFFYVTLNLNPSPSNQVTQGAYSYLYGVTPYPVFGNQALFATLKAANINFIGTGAEGGITNTIEYYGHTLDGMDFNKWWYSIDNVQINLDLNNSNAVINGSNNPLAPLNYNQAGINTLQAVGISTMQSEIAYSLALGTLVSTQMTGQAFAAAVEAGQFAGQVVVNAVPFASYAAINPGDYKIGQYSGLSVAYAPQLGFLQIIYNVVASSFV
jgi:hypothetical protein